MVTIDGIIKFHKEFDVLHVEFCCNCNGEFFQLSTDMKLEDLVKKIFNIK